MRTMVLVSGSLHEELYLLNTIDDGMNFGSYYFVCVHVWMDGLTILWHM